MGMHIRVGIATGGVSAIILVTEIFAPLVEGHHIGPDLVDVGRVGVVHHIGRVAARRAHVHFQTDVVAFAAEPFTVAVQLEELQVDETAGRAEGLDGAAADTGQFGRNGLVDPVSGVEVPVDDVHNRLREHGVVFKDRLQAGIVDGVVAQQLAGDELFDDKAGSIGMGIKPGVQLGIAAKLVGAAGAHAAVGFGNHRITGFGRERPDRFAAFGALDLPGGRNTAQGVVFLHLALVADGGHTVAADAGRHAEGGTQAGILLKPVFVVRFDPVDLAVLVGEPGYAAVHLVVVFQAVHLIIIREILAQLPREILVVRVRNTQHVHAVALRAGAELPIGMGKMRGYEYQVHKRIGLVFFTNAVHRAVGDDIRLAPQLAAPVFYLDKSSVRDGIKAVEPAVGE